jgi:hypothetical protein
MRRNVVLIYILMATAEGERERSEREIRVEKYAATAIPCTTEKCHTQ